MVKLRKLYISTVVVTIIYSICLFIGGLLIDKVSGLENDIYINIESYIRSEQNYIISSILDKMEYDVLENKLNVDELDDVSKWCNYNYSFIALNNSKTDYFVVEMDSDNIVDSSSLTIKSDKESIYKSSNDILQKDELSSLIKQIKETKESSNELTVETYGTYHLPEAQMDRFFMKLSMGYPEPSEEIKILERTEKNNPIKNIYLYQL